MTPQAIFIQGNYLGVFGTQWENSGMFRIAYTYIRIYDISNRARPNLLREYKI
jgi:hypothetical protein